MARWRLGVVILLPDEVTHEINGLRRALGDGALGRMAPHITLVPPVNVRDDDLGNAVDVLRTAAAAMAPFEVTIGPMQSFRPESPTLKLDVGPRGRVSVHRLRNAVFVPPFARPLTFAFVPHVTLVEELDERRTAAALVALSSYSATFTVDRVWVMREQKRQWAQIVDAGLRPPLVVGRGGRELELSVTRLVDPIAARICGVESMLTTLAVTARTSGVPVGVIAGVHDGAVFRLAILAVAEHERGTGIGGHLVRALLGELAVALVVNESAVGEAFLAPYGFSDGRLAL